MLQQLPVPSISAPFGALCASALDKIKSGGSRSEKSGGITIHRPSNGHNHAAPRTPLESPCFATSTGVSASFPNT